ncbi:DISARM anti-phage system protein DrmE domain-containing protein [Cellulomonas hominis]
MPNVYPPVTGGGLSTAVVDGRLRLRTNGVRLPFAPTRFDVELLAAVDAAVGSDVPIALVVPLPGTGSPLLVGAATLVGSVLKSARLNGQVAVVSSALRARTLYDELAFGDQHLADFMPRTTVDITGHARVVGHPATPQAGRLHLVNELSRITGWSGDLCGIVIDASAASAADVRTVLGWRPAMPVVYLTGDPFDPALDVMRAEGGVVWAWDAAAAGALAAPAASFPNRDAGPVLVPSTVLRAIGSSCVEVRTPDGPAGAYDQAAQAAWQALVNLSGVYRRTTGTDRGLVEAARWAWGVFNTLTLVPVPPARYDEHVPPGPYTFRLGEVASTARAYARNAAGDVRQAWYEVADRFADLLAAANSPDRLGGAAGWIEQVVDVDGRGLLVVRNRAAAAATRLALASSTATSLHWDDHVQVATLSDVAAGRTPAPVDELYLPGPLPRTHGALLAMPAAPLLVVGAAGPFEARRAVRQALTARQLLAELRTETQQVAAPMLAVPATAAADDDPRARVQLLAGEVADLSAFEAAAAGTDNPWEPFDVDVLAMLQKVVATGGRGADDVPAPPPARTAGAQVRVICVHVDAGSAGPRVLVVEPNDLVTRHSGRATARVAAKSLVPGDVVLLVDGAARKDLLGSVLDKLSESPQYAALSSLVRFWHARAARPHGGMTMREIRQRMHGTRITSDAAIGTWVRGEVDGPQDPDDVKRFARAVRDCELALEADRIGWALRTLHGVHHKVGHWLSAQLSGVNPAAADQVIDADLGIRVADLLEAVTTNVVVALDTDEMTAPASAVGLAMTPGRAAATITRP